jgi:hypothetical protein
MLVLAGIQVILVVRLEALVSNRPSALDLSLCNYNPFSWTLVRLSAWITGGELIVQARDEEMFTLNTSTVSDFATSNPCLREAPAPMKIAVFRVLHNI